MTSRSSIFSFDTLSLPRTFPVATAFAICLLLACELGARALVATGHLEEDKSLRLTLVTRIKEIKAQKPPVWFLGNSTLDWGIDAPALSKMLNVPIYKLPHGSATVNSSAAMLDFYIKQTGIKPKLVVVTVTKDDFNPNGSRAKISQAYLDVANQNAVPTGDFLMLRSARASIRDKVTDGIDSLRYPNKRVIEPVIKTFSGKPIPDDYEFTRILVTDFEFRADWINELKAVCDRHQLPAPVLVLMPVTDRYLQYHDRVVKTPTYEQIHQQTLETARTAGVTVIDFWETPRTDYHIFRDAYHLTPEGCAWLTPLVAEQLKGKTDIAATGSK